VPPKPYLAPPFYPSVHPADPHVRALAIPGYYQVRGYTCGFACTLMVLHYYRRYVTGRELYARLGTDRDGTRQGAIVRELRAAGLGARAIYDLDFARLRAAIDAGRPIIGYHHRLEHWVVLYGYGDNPQRVLVADPIREHRGEHAWSTYGAKLHGFGIVTAPRARGRLSPPRFATAY
jgi:ABC-type bacteriocin/lantibiotic exporter with double-glycine peptidase domain